MRTQFFRLLPLIFLLIISSPGAQAAPPAPKINLTLEELGSGDLLLRGLYGAAFVWIPFQTGWVLQEEVSVDVTYVASPLLDQKLSTLTILANDVPVASLHPIADGAEQRFSFSIPVNQLQGPGVALRFQGFLRLTDHPCEPSFNPGQWLNILAKTRLTFAPGPDTTLPDLADLPRPIVVENAPESPPPTIFVLPDRLETVTLTTAAQVAARLGQGSSGNLFPFEAETANTLTGAQKQTANLVVVGLPQDQPLIAQMAGALPATFAQTGFVTADNIISPPEHGVIQIFNSPWNEAHQVLLVSGGQPAGLQLAGQAFADQLTFQSLHGSFQFVRALETVASPQPGRPWLTPKTTFAQLGDLDRTVTGVGVHDEFYFFRRPPGWLFDTGSQLTLHLGFSPVLRASESYVAAFINDVQCWHNSHRRWN